MQHTLEGETLEEKKGQYSVQVRSCALVWDLAISI